MEIHEITIVQGDDYSCELEIKNAQSDDIEIYFSCNKLNLCRKLVYDEMYNSYVLTLSSEETMNFEKGIYDYDFTIKVVESIKTIQYKSRITILEKTNKVVCYGG